MKKNIYIALSLAAMSCLRADTDISLQEALKFEAKIAPEEDKLPFLFPFDENGMYRKDWVKLVEEKKAVEADFEPIHSKPINLATK